MCLHICIVYVHVCVHVHVLENCAAGDIISGGAIMAHDVILHDQSTAISCSETHTGVLTVSCSDGETNITDGECVGQ